MPHHDRRGGLVVFGIGLIATGCVCGLLVPLLLAGRIVLPQAASDTGSVREAASRGPGVRRARRRVRVAGRSGSIRARRWAPPLILTVAWIWLITGVLGVGVTALILPSIFDMVASQGEPLPAEVTSILTVMALGDLERRDRGAACGAGPLLPEPPRAGDVRRV